MDKHGEVINAFQVGKIILLDTKYSAEEDNT